MTKKKTVIITVAILFVVVSFVSCKVISDRINRQMNPEVPARSVKGKVILASGGCCFSATDVVIYIQDESGIKTALIEEEKVNEFDIYECENIPRVETKIKVGIDFVGHYSGTKDVFLIVGEFSNTDELLREGLLLRFGDGDLTVRNGEAEKLFRDSVFGGEGNDPWFQER